MSSVICTPACPRCRELASELARLREQRLDRDQAPAEAVHRRGQGVPGQSSCPGGDWLAALRRAEGVFLSELRSLEPAQFAAGCGAASSLDLAACRLALDRLSRFEEGVAQLRREALSQVASELAAEFPGNSITEVLAAGEPADLDPK